MEETKIIPLKEKIEDRIKRFSNDRVSDINTIVGIKIDSRTSLQNLKREINEEIMKTEKEDYGEYSKNKICDCGSHKLSHCPHFIDDKEVCDIINKAFKKHIGELE